MRSKFEIRADKMLKSEGYQVDYKMRPSRFPPKGYQVDYFGLFDLLAYKEGEPLRWISVKGTTNTTTENRRKIENFPMPEGNIKEQWRFDRDPKNKRRIRCRKTIIK